MKTMNEINKENWPDTVIIRIPAKYATEEAIFNNSHKEG